MVVDVPADDEALREGGGVSKLAFSRFAPLPTPAEITPVYKRDIDLSRTFFNLCIGNISPCIGTLAEVLVFISVT